MKADTHFVSVLALLTCACGSGDESGTIGWVESYGGDPANLTEGGVPRFRYPVRDCAYELKVDAPFEVSKDGWGRADIRVPLAYLDDPRSKATVPVATLADGTNDQDRLSFAFPSFYRGDGMKEGLARSVRARVGRAPRPLSDAPSFLNSAASHHKNGLGGESTYLGRLRTSQDIAMMCSATNWQNPTCEAEVGIGDQGRRFSVKLPPRAVARLDDIVAMGTKLIDPASKACAATSARTRT